MVNHQPHRIGNKQVAVVIWSVDCPFEQSQKLVYPDANLLF